MSTLQNNSNSLDGFVCGLIKARGLDGLDKEVVDQIKSDLLERVEDRINAVILANIPQEKLGYLEKLLEQSNHEQIQSFCRRNIYNIEDLMAAELAAFRDTYLSA